MFAILNLAVGGPGLEPNSHRIPDVGTAVELGALGPAVKHVHGH